MDDLLTGANTLKEAKVLRDQIIHILEQGQFSLTKWASNHVELLPSKTSSQEELILLNSDSKTLGLIWNPSSDILKYTGQTITNKIKISKRTILSTIAKLFDPLGLVGPVIVVAKIIMQKLWLLNLNWEESIPTDLHTTWTQFLAELSILHKLEIPRNVITQYPAINIELHGFSDASEAAYGCCVYIKHTDIHGQHFSQPLCAKSRVAPVKQISLPRLELCGALLLAQLQKRVSQSLDHLVISDTFLWTDSKLVLIWLKGVPNQWKTFIGNRVSQIQQLTRTDAWHHIKGIENPADIISRGLLPQQLKQSNLWWNGPPWLLQDKTSYPLDKLHSETSISSEMLEQRKSFNSLLVSSNSTFLKFINNIFGKFSSYDKLTRIIAWCLRYINNLRMQTKSKNSAKQVKIQETKNKVTLKDQFLSLSEIRASEIIIIRIVQAQGFPLELHDLKLKGRVKKKSRLLALAPFLDGQNILRVGGRLKNAAMSYQRKFPILLPDKHYVTKLIIRKLHEQALHAGPQGTLAMMRQKFWTTSAKSLIRKIVHNCIICFKANPHSTEQLMGDLPATRVNITRRPFLNSGIDYAGPITIKEGFGRNRKFIKTYIALFVCLNTKAIHLELVTKLDIDSFLGALKRFIGRRGHILNLYSDNATNFTGSDRELRAVLKAFREADGSLATELNNHNITWHFIPPRSPHIGGIWEAGMKSVKFHLKRTIGNANLNYEQLYTLLVQIEAILNSRPLCPLSSDPNDLYSLTPGHFIIGDAMTAPLEPDLQHLTINKLSNWQHISLLRQHFWKRWSQEYLHTLQQRTKWTDKHPGPSVGDLALLKNEDTPPLHWKLGRVIELHPGQDKLVRVVSLKTKGGVTKRAITKLCFLPLTAEGDKGDSD